MILANSVSSFSQCSLGCNSNVQLSLDNATCSAVVTPAMMLGTVPPTSCPAGTFTVELRHNGVLIPGALVTSAYVGKTLEAKVIDGISGNSCWGYVHVEDKLAPVITCIDPESIYCYETENYKPAVVENCGDYTLNVTDISVITNDCNGPLADNVLKVITRTYVAVDKSGNKSAPCTITFDVLAIDDLNDIDAPINYLYPTNNLQCDGNFPKDSNGNPHPSFTGVPELDGVKLFPNPYIACNILVSYTDQRLPAIGCVTKIMRTWTIIEWSCTNRPPRTILQMIEIADTKGPVITGAKDLTVSTGVHKCEGTVVVPPITVTDNCTPTNQIKVTISGGTSLIETNGGVTTLPVGDHKLVYKAVDWCGNVTEKIINVWVQDNTPPVAVCDQNTTVGLTSDGTAWVHASTFDDGSFDECKLAKMLVRRMNPGCTPCKEPDFPGFSYLGSFEGHYYYVSQHPLTPALAHKHAKALGGYGVSIETALENNWLAGKLNDYNDTLCYLTGLSATSPYFQWKWESGAPYSYQNFGSTLIQDPKYYACINGEDGTWNLWENNQTAGRYIVEITDPCGFSSYAKFCCSDIATSPVMVQFRVIDAACNWNDCMVNAFVQDKLPPTITCPKDMTVDCNVVFDKNNLKASFGEATYVDNCNLTFNETFVENINQCHIGFIKRTFTATNGVNGSSSCDQFVYFKAIKPFYINSQDPLDPRDNVIWPTDVTMEGCDNPADNEYLPENLPAGSKKPEFVNDPGCSLVGTDYEDHIFTFNNSNGDACFKILRKWKVIDWCQFENGEYPSWTYTQVIKVNNTVDPIIRSSCARKEVCTYDAECLDGYIELTASATDDCTRGLKWTAKIDLDNDGKFDASWTRSGVGTSATQANPTVATATGTYPIGSHRVQWVFEDKCGNITTCDQLFDVVNCKAPTPYLLNGLAVDLMPVDNNGDGKIDGGMVELWASDFNQGSSHPCFKTVYMSFSPNINDRSKTFTCANLGNNTVRVYASVITPMGDTIRAWANASLSVQDNMKACTTTVTQNRVVVRGNLHTEAVEGVSNASMILSGNEQMIEVTNTDGAYAFNDILTGNSYTLSGVKNDDYLNGVSTLDLVLIQRHILGLSKLNSPYLLIAADANKDNKVTAGDLVELRRLILGINDKLSNNNSWRFVDKGQVFPDPTNPFANDIKESYEISEINADMNIDFMAVKVGDVNASVKANATYNVVEPRSNDKLVLNVEDKSFKKGEEVKVTLSTSQLTQLYGMQFTLKFNSQIAELINVKGIDIDLNEANLGLTKVSEGLIATSWNSKEMISINDLMEVTFVAKADGTMSELLNINSDIAVAEAYDENMDIMKIELRNGDAQAQGFELYQNTPNPFSSTTSIGFRIPEANDVTFTIMDVTGKVIVSNTKYFNAGAHTISIDKNTLGQSGILYYQIEAGEFTATKKMVIIE